MKGNEMRKEKGKQRKLNLNKVDLVTEWTFFSRWKRVEGECFEKNGPLNIDECEEEKE